MKNIFFHHVIQISKIRYLRFVWDDEKIFSPSRFFSSSSWESFPLMVRDAIQVTKENEPVKIFLFSLCKLFYGTDKFSTTTSVNSFLWEWLSFFTAAEVRRILNVLLAWVLTRESGKFFPLKGHLREFWLLISFVRIRDRHGREALSC